MSQKIKLLPKCKHLLSKEAARLAESKYCDAMYEHHHCLNCEWPISNKQFPDNKYCGACAYDFGEDWPKQS